jgi:uncharacterized membrane protein YidH (DUF202 family)
MIKINLLTGFRPRKWPVETARVKHRKNGLILFLSILTGIVAAALTLIGLHDGFEILERHFPGIVKAIILYVSGRILLIVTYTIWLRQRN